MKKKTLLKLQRRLEKLPLHHIDTSIILEPEKTENGRYCRKYLQKVGYNFRGKISFSVLGEILLNIMSLENYTEQHTALDLFQRLIKVRKIGLYVQKRTEDIVKRIREIDARIDPIDAEILACTIEDEAQVLITLGTKLIHNEKLEKEFGIRIRHPNELL